LDVSSKSEKSPLSHACIKVIMATLQGRMRTRDLQGLSDSVRDETAEVEWISRRCAGQTRRMLSC
jgi:hypothetical protein